MKKSIAIILSIMFVLGITFPATAISTIAVKSIKLNNSNITLKVGQTTNLKATLTPVNTTQKLLTFVTWNPKVATIDKTGKITGVSAGTATIVVYTPNKNIFAKCIVTVPKLFSKPITLTLSIPLYAGQEMNADLYIIKAIQAKTNVYLDVNAIPRDGYDDKINVMLNTGEASDITNSSIVNLCSKFGDAGIFENLKNHLDEMPNFSKFYNDPKYKQYLSYYKTVEGNFYLFPQLNRGDSERVGWLYRSDIFDKNNIKVPTNDTELYNVLKKLKQIYPKSYPLSFRNGVSRIAYMAESWGSSIDMYFNSQQKKWIYGPIEDNFKACVEFINKLYKEELLPTNIMSLSKAGWTQLMSNKEDSFMTYDYLGRIDSFYDTVKDTIPDYRLKYMPPIKGGKNGNTNNYSTTTLCIIGNAISATSKNVAEAIKFTDWMYSDEGTNLCSWGEEGKTYKVVNGEKQYTVGLDNLMLDVGYKYGLWTDGFYTRVDPQAYLARGTKEVNDAVNTSRKYDAPLVPNVLFTESESETLATTLTSLTTYRDEQISKFILGIRPFSEWDKYVKEMKDIGLQKIIDLYNTAYARMK